MADRGRVLGGSATLASGTRSTGKRKAVDDSQLSLGHVKKPRLQPTRKRIQASPIDLTGDDPEYDEPTTKHKKAKSAAPRKKVALEVHGEDNEAIRNKKTKGINDRGQTFEDYLESEEKRLKRYKPKMPQSFVTTMERAVTQRMFVIDRKRHINEDCPHLTQDCPMETIDLAGTTGNCYQVVITHSPTCTCPNFVKGNSQCKHIIYVLIKVLKVTGDLQYQAAFLTSELREIFDKAGPLPSDTVTAEDKDGKRKTIEGECPICVEDLDPKAEEIVWCHAACGNNLHKTCFDQWAASKRGGVVTCPYCRTPWQAGVDEQAIRNISKSGSLNGDGYVNIANQLGISGRRDYSTYHPFWVRQEHREGRIDRANAAPHYDYDYDSP